MPGYFRSLLIAVVLALPAAVPASAANWFEMGIYMTGPRYDGDLPPCESGLGTIVSNFSTKEGRFWNSDLQILDFEGVRETAFRPWGANTIPRRFCSAVATISDGTKHKVHYWIGESVGYAGASWGVEWCVVGLDRNWAYNPACRMAKP